jgi:prepilin signal peptidase PulO-like enzyme (type II secretory pathway)
VNAILAIPLPLRLGLLLIAGACLGGLVNWAAYSMAWNARPISPWSRGPAGKFKRGWLDRVPVFGWLALRREAKHHGRGFWLRPLAVELLLGVGAALLYWWEVDQHGLYALVQLAPPGAGALVSTNFDAVVNAQFLAHLILIVIMLAASLIDFDEQQIPDVLTIPGTLLGLALATAYPWSMLPGETWNAGGGLAVEFVTCRSPNPWPLELPGQPAERDWLVALGCWSLWCAGVLPRPWNTRHGLRTAVRVLFHRILRERLSYITGAIWLAGTLWIVAAAALADRAHWAGLVSSLVGLVVGGGIIWAVRQIGTAALRREAMGFGDVMLMSMIGTFLGWQACVLVFFLGPFFGLISGVVQWTMHRENESPYGPYLCLAALLVIVKWPGFWDWGYDLFALGWLLPAVLGVCLVLMGLMLWMYRLVRERISP